MRWNNPNERKSALGTVKVISVHKKGANRKIAFLLRENLAQAFAFLDLERQWDSPPGNETRGDSPLCPTAHCAPVFLELT